MDNTWIWLIFTWKNHQKRIETVSGWWLSLWKRLDFVNWDDEIPFYFGKVKSEANHQPDVILVAAPVCALSSGHIFENTEHMKIHMGFLGIQRQKPRTLLWKADMFLETAMFGANCLHKPGDVVKRLTNFTGINHNNHHHSKGANLHHLSLKKVTFGDDYAWCCMYIYIYTVYIYGIYIYIGIICRSHLALNLDETTLW